MRLRYGYGVRRRGVHELRRRADSGTDDESEPGRRSRGSGSGGGGGSDGNGPNDGCDTRRPDGHHPLHALPYRHRRDRFLHGHARAQEEAGGNRRRARAPHIAHGRKHGRRLGDGFNQRGQRRRPPRRARRGMDAAIRRNARRVVLLARERALRCCPVLLCCFLSQV